MKTTKTETPLSVLKYLRKIARKNRAESKNAKLYFLGKINAYDDAIALLNYKKSSPLKKKIKKCSRKLAASY
jgi:hypothetical protein